MRDFPANLIVNASSEFAEPPGLQVTVDRVFYEPDAETPVERPYCFVYFISIHNQTEESVTIKGRKWVVTNNRGEVMVVEGDGVVGQHPTIEPGGRFSYNSYHLLDTHAAIAEGSYIGMDAKGRKVLVRIPPFKMVVEKPGL
ncbi:MAG TPA: ApaG domain [Verrucomicrobiae bacterium]